MTPIGSSARCVEIRRLRQHDSIGEKKERVEMGGTLSPVSKGRLMKAIDRMLEQPTTEYLEELVNGLSMVDLGLAKQILKDGQVSHVEDEVFGDQANQQAWWPAATDKQAVIRGGFVQALKVSLAHGTPVPIQCYWINGVGEDTFEIVVADCPNQVNLFLLTSKPKNPPAPPATGGREDMWVVATNARCAALMQDVPANYNPDPPEQIDCAPGVQVVRLWGY
jgi:hypothetical protein